MSEIPLPAILDLTEFIARAERLVVLTGAGCSTESGIPDYRSPNGTWQRHRPVLFSEFSTSPAVRRRYWARAFRGWPAFSSAKPNHGHRSLATLESAGRIDHLITQNVDELHQTAGSKRVVELHGSNHAVVCLDCRSRFSRQQIQDQMKGDNPGWTAGPVLIAPDGDAEIDPGMLETFVTPLCRDCGGVLKPDVVFFGESVPKDRVRFSMERIDEADALLVVGSSLTVWSGFRFTRRAAEREVPIAILNLGPTRADDLAALKVEASCGAALRGIVERLC